VSASSCLNVRDRLLDSGARQEILAETALDGGTADAKPSTNRATEMDITMIGLQNAGKTSLLRVLAVSLPTDPQINHRPAADSFAMDRVENLPSSMHYPSPAVLLFPCGVLPALIQAHDRRKT
jgi:hypothetical protein